MLRAMTDEVAANFQLVIDCADADRLARFWAAALGYVLAPPPAGFDSWDDYWRDMGLPEEDLVIGEDRIVDPAGHGPQIWFQQETAIKTIKNRLHIDIRASGGREVPLETRKKQVDAEAQRLAGLGATITCVLYTEGFDHYAVGMQDPEGNEFDIN
jgi:Glyoxalase-like domain